MPNFFPSLSLTREINALPLQLKSNEALSAVTAANDIAIDNK